MLYEAVDLVAMTAPDTLQRFSDYPRITMHSIHRSRTQTSTLFGRRQVSREFLAPQQFALSPAEYPARVIGRNLPNVLIAIVHYQDPHPQGRCKFAQTRVATHSTNSHLMPYVTTPALSTYFLARAPRNSHMNIQTISELSGNLRAHQYLSVEMCCDSRNNGAQHSLQHHLRCCHCREFCALAWGESGIGAEGSSKHQ